MRAFTLLTVGVLAGLQAASAAGPIEQPVAARTISGPQPPATEQLGEVVGSFTFPNPPIPPYLNIPGLGHDGSGNLYRSDLSVPRFFVVNTHPPIAQLIEGPFAVETHSVTPKGITTDGSHVHIGDASAPADIDGYDLAGNSVRSFSVTSQTGFPQGIAHSRITDALCVVDGQGGNKVSEFTRDGDFVQNFTINGSSQNGLAFDPTSARTGSMTEAPTRCATTTSTSWRCRASPARHQPAAGWAKGLRSSGTGCT